MATTKAATKNNTKTMHKEMQHILDHAQALVDATSGEIDDQIKAARDALKERLESVKNEYGVLEDRLVDTIKAADEFMHAKPYHASGGSLIAGLILGWFIFRK